MIFFQVLKICYKNAEKFEWCPLKGFLFLPIQLRVSGRNTYKKWSNTFKAGGQNLLRRGQISGKIRVP